ncbi:hypothetical protein K710_0100 [Streptococcus iniae SF1]|nr:hypothetical protein K710_0100 [Streptococcus iniae SF1]
MFLGDSKKEYSSYYHLKTKTKMNDSFFIILSQRGD